jgi:hypothetical protein
LAEAVMTRVIGWTKIFGIVAGVPLCIAALVLTMFGIRTYTDFKAKKAEVTDAASEATKSIGKDAADTKAMADTIKADTDELDLERGKEFDRPILCSRSRDDLEAICTTSMKRTSCYAADSLKPIWRRTTLILQ